MERGILQGIALLRWLAWTLVVGILLTDRGELARPWLAILMVVAALAITVHATVRLRFDPLVLLSPVVVAVELVIGFTVSLSDGWAFGTGHAFSPASQSLGGAWPIAGVLTTGVAGSWVAGVAAGLGIGMARAGAIFANGIRPGHLTGVEIISLASSAVLYAIAGGVIGRVASLLRSAAQEISSARAREEVARTLHDGVLQTLALIQRGNPGSELAHLAREQEHELRDFLFGPAERERRLLGRDQERGSRQEGAWAGWRRRSLELDLRSGARRYEARFGGRVDVLVAHDVPDLGSDVIDAVGGAVGEALTNAGKHGSARRVTIFVEPDAEGGIFCSVKDDGSGFHPEAVAEGVGMSRSIRSRIREVGGSVEVSSEPGRGTEVRLMIPRGADGRRSSGLRLQRERGPDEAGGVEQQNDPDKDGPR